MKITYQLIKKIIKLYFGYFLFTFMFLLHQFVHGQEINDVELTHIRWIKQLPQISSNKPGIAKRISDFVFGKIPPNLSKPISIYAKNPDTCWILDHGNSVIYQSYNGVGDIPRLSGEEKLSFSSLVGICSFDNNNLLFTDSKLNKIFVFNTKNKRIDSFIVSRPLQQPTGIAYSSNSHKIWVVETAAHRISVFNEKGKLLKTIGQRGNSIGEFNFPTFIWIDEHDRVYIIDSMNFRVQIFNSDGKVLKVFGEIGDATGYFARPKGIATDSFGNIYVVDALFHTVQIFDKEGKFLYNFGTQGQNTEEFWMPAGIFIDNENYIYVADTYNSRIQIFQLIYEK